MSTIEESVKGPDKPRSIANATWDYFLRFVNFLSLVKFGVVLLCILVFLSMLGMIIIQQNVQGFDAYYAGLTPAERTVFGALGLFDIYYSWYFNLILLILSLNIILASIDRFPSAWSYIVKPKLHGTKAFLLNQDENAEIGVAGGTRDEIAAKVESAIADQGLRTRITEHEGKLFVFGERGRWNRMGAYIVHVALLTLFLGHFVAFQTGFDADVNMVPGEATEQIQLIRINLDQQERYAVGLPFRITCLDIEQKLIDPNGSIETFNTLDWRTRIEIDDPQYGVTVADVSLNNPFSYRGYRFFQAQTVPVGNARTMKLQLTPQNGGEPLSVDLKRNGEQKLPDGTVVAYEAFMPDFTFNERGEPDTRTADYNNPAAVLKVTSPGGEVERVFAFAANISDDIPVGAPKLGYKWRLTEFEKSPLAHVLSIKYDPYNGAFIAWYFGGFGLIFALIFVFFISHKRVWAMIEEMRDPDRFNVVLGGHTNRNHFAFEDKFKKIVARLTDRPENAGGRMEKADE